MDYSLLFGDRADRVRALFGRTPLPTMAERWSIFPPVWAGGLVDSPAVAFIFINPTLRNQSAREHWNGDRAPFIGIRRPWKFLASCGLLDPRLVEVLPNDQTWDASVAMHLYSHVARQKLYVTNLVKSCRDDSVMPSLAEARGFLSLLAAELQIVAPQVVVPMGGMVASLLTGRQVSLGEALEHLRRNGSPYVAGRFADAEVVPSYFPVGRGSPTKAREILTELSL
jgi:hypothetical protein